MVCWIESPKSWKKRRMNYSCVSLEDSDAETHRDRRGLAHDSERKGDCVWDHSCIILDKNLPLLSVF